MVNVALTALPKASPAVCNVNPARRFVGLPPMKNINWKNIITILIVAVLAAIFIVPLIRPLIQKIPLIGKYAAVVFCFTLALTSHLVRMSC